VQQPKNHMEEKITLLKQLLAKIDDLDHTSALLGWDQQVYMPQAGAEERAELLANISEITHNLSVSDELGSLLRDVKPLVDQLDPDSDEARLVKVAQRAFDKNTKIPADLIVDFTRTTANAHFAWQEAREKNNFKLFEPHLQRIVELVQSMAECFKPYDHIYDPLLDMFEPGVKTKEVNEIFSKIRPLQMELINTISGQPQVDDSFLKQKFPDQKQWDFGIMVAEKFGMTWNRSRQDRSVHPFTTSFGQNDVRITTKIYEDLPMSALFSTMHEAGHALYELGFDPKHRRTPLSSAASSAFHESQARLWENVVGRSKEFWQHFYPILQSHFPTQLGNVPEQSFYKAINKVEPSLIRVEADESTYNLHIMLRFEIEKSLMEGQISVTHLPDMWNTLMKEYLNITPLNDSDGVLQDVHWSGGMFGYFPTYALGNILSIQLWEKINYDVSDLSDKIAAGDFVELLSWLQKNVQQYGAKYEPNELILKVTGSRINPIPYVNYLINKYSDIYNFRSKKN